MIMIDLTHVFTKDMPVYPGDPCSKLYQCATIQKDGFTDHKIESCMHVGTHMDAPLHMIENTAVISDFPVDQFQGRGILIDARGKSEITAELLKEKFLKPRDIVLVWTGWDKKYRTDEYFKNWPIIMPCFAQKLIDAKVSLVGMDTAGPDDDERFIVHKMLLPENILIIENMTNLESLEQVKAFKVHAYPAKYQADAAPVRVVAEVE